MDNINRIDRLNFAIIEHVLSGVVIRICTLLITDESIVFWILLFVYHFIGPLFMKGQTLFMFFLGIEVKCSNPGDKLTYRLIAKRLILRFLFFLPIFTMLYMFININEVPVYDKKCNLYLTRTCL